MGPFHFHRPISFESIFIAIIYHRITARISSFRLLNFSSQLYDFIDSFLSKLRLSFNSFGWLPLDFIHSFAALRCFIFWTNWAKHKQAKQFKNVWANFGINSSPINCFIAKQHINLSQWSKCSIFERKFMLAYLIF